MYRTAVRICLIACFASLGGRGNAAQPQAAFKIVNGSDNGQNGGAVALPVLSFVLDNTHRLRPLIGIVGAASIGSALDLDFDVVQAAIPPGHDYVLAMTNASTWPLLLQVHGGTITVRSIDSFMSRQRQQQSDCSQPADAPLPRRGNRSECSLEPSPAEGTTINRIALSPAGSAAALFSEAQRSIYVLTNLSQSPALLGTFLVRDLGALSAFGVSDDGKTVAVGVSDGDTGSLFLLSPGQPARLIAPMRHPSAITFLYGSDSAVISDDVENKIYTVSNGQGVTAATAENGISRPIGLAVSHDNQRIFVGNSQSGSVTTIGPNGNVAEPRSCNCTLTGLYPTNSDSVFRLTDFSGGPVLLFDATAAAPRMIFVPMTGSQF